MEGEVKKDSKHQNNSYTHQEDMKNNKDKPTTVTIGDVKIDIHHDPITMEPTELLEELFVLRYNDTLTKEEKNIQLQELVKKYLG